MLYKSHRVDLRLSSGELDQVQELLDLIRETQPKERWQSQWNRTSVLMFAVGNLLTQEKIALQAKRDREAKELIEAEEKLFPAKKPTPKKRKEKANVAR